MRMSPQTFVVRAVADHGGRHSLCRRTLPGYAACEINPSGDTAHVSPSLVIEGGYRRVGRSCACGMVLSAEGGARISGQCDFGPRLSGPVLRKRRAARTARVRRRRRPPGCGGCGRAEGRRAGALFGVSRAAARRRFTVCTEAGLRRQPHRAGPDGLGAGGAPTAPFAVLPMSTWRSRTGSREGRSYVRLMGQTLIPFEMLFGDRLILAGGRTVLRGGEVGLAEPGAQKVECVEFVPAEFL